MPLPPPAAAARHHASWQAHAHAPGPAPLVLAPPHAYSHVGAPAPALWHLPPEQLQWQGGAQQQWAVLTAPGVGAPHGGAAPAAAGRRNGAAQRRGAAATAAAVYGDEVLFESAVPVSVSISRGGSPRVAAGRW